KARRTGVPAAASAACPSASENATPSITLYASAAASVEVVRPKNTPLALALLCGVRSPLRYGRKIGARSMSADSAARANAASLSARHSLAAQLRLVAADRVTVIWIQRSGNAWQKLCIACSGFDANRSAATTMTPELPSDTVACP